MAHDAIEQSLSEAGPSLERQVNDLQSILGHLLNAISETRDQVAADEAKISRCQALAASAQARAELAVRNAAEAVPVAREAALEELLRIAQAAGDEDRPRHAEPKPKRRRLPPGWGGIVASGVVALGVLKAHRVAAAAGAVALTAATAAPIAGVMLPDTDAPHVAVAAVHHFHPRRADQDPVTGAVLPPRRRHGAVTKSVRRRRAPSPKASAAPTAAPTPTPTPSPDPGPTGMPTPSPGPIVTAAPTSSPGMLLSPAAAQWQH